MLAGKDVLSVFYSMGALASDALPYHISDEMLRALLNSGSKPYPSPGELEKMGKNKQLGLFIAGMKKSVGCEPIDEPGEIILFLTQVYCDLATRSKTENVDKEIEDKLIIYACNKVAKRWEKLGKLCSGLSSIVIHNNEAMLHAVHEAQRRSGQRLMFLGAVAGSSIRLALRFGKHLSKTSPSKQILYLLHESPGDPEDRRKFLAIARACQMCKNETFVQNDGLQKILDIFKDDPTTTAMFLDYYLQQTIESNDAREMVA